MIPSHASADPPSDSITIAMEMSRAVNESSCLECDDNRHDN